MLKRSSCMALAAVAVLALIVIGCAAPPAPAPTAAPPPPAAPPVIQTVIVPGTPIIIIATAVPATPAPPPPVAKKSITVIANWGGGEKEAFQKVLDGFTAKTGIVVNYETSRNLTALLRTRVAGGNPPDVAMDPRPGEIAEFARAGNLIPLDEPIGKEAINPDELKKAFGDAYLNLGKVDGTLYGLIFKADSKSTFWYKPDSFKDLGVQAPKTYDELVAIADKYVAKGKVPFGSGGKDGWVLTDWFEQIYARVASPKMYVDLHVTHKVAWTDPTVKKALTEFTRIWGNPKFFSGGTQGALGTGFVDGISQVFGTKPVAEMFYEGGFVGTIAMADINKSLKPGVDIDFFPWPQVDAQYGDPVIGGGDFAIMFKDTPEGRAFMQYLASKEAGEIFAGTNSISPNKLVDPSKFSSELRKKEFQQIANAKVFLFDGSDLAPSALGGDYEFAKLQDLAAHPKDVDRVATELENFAKTAY